tara:strand:- start:1703 stop:2926 length:1224 start_codon:yes stop_codon:yes gene_type:complete
MNKQQLIDFESKIINHYNNNKLPFLFHLSGGNETQLIDIFKDIKTGDYVLATHRNHYHALLHGLSPDDMEQKILDGRSMFMYDREKNFFASAIVGGIPGIAAGIAWALKKKKSDKKVWCFVGDGAEDTGNFSEAVRYVDGWDLPCTFVIEDNDMSIIANKKTRWGKAAEQKWPESCVIKYHYTLPFPHARTKDFCDLSESNKIKKTDEEYFPYFPQETFPDFDEINGETLTYKEAVTQAMTELGRDNTMFIGYNLGGEFGNAMGTLVGVDEDKKLETPVTENLMGSLALGMSFEGIKAVVYYERHDFMLVGADAIGNHINHVERLSHGEYNAPVILRTVVADGGPFYSGPTHSQDFTKVFRELVDFPIFEPTTPTEVLRDYKKAQMAKGPVMIVERKSCYDGKTTTI